MGMNARDKAQGKVKGVRAHRVAEVFVAECHVVRDDCAKVYHISPTL